MMREPTDIRRQQAQRAVQALRARVDRLDDDAIDLILRDARSHYAWTDRPVGEDLLRTLFEITIAGQVFMLVGPAMVISNRSRSMSSLTGLSVQA